MSVVRVAVLGAVVVGVCGVWCGEAVGRVDGGEGEAVGGGDGGGGSRAVGGGDGCEGSGAVGGRVEGGGSEAVGSRAGDRVVVFFGCLCRDGG